jgi:hypothetical protein
MAPPTRGHCTGAIAFKIDQGHYGDLSLDGLLVAATFYFPRAIHHGQGQMQPLLEPKATPEQREAIFYIMSGENQPVGTMFQIFSVIVEHHHDPIMTKLEMEIDVKARNARIEAPQSLRARSESIRNPVTDAEHRILTVLPDGWVFHEGEGAVGHSKSVGGLKFELDRSHSSLAYVAWGPNGVTYNLEEARRRFPLD